MLPGVDVVGCERWKSCCRAANNCCRRQRSLRTKDSSSSSSSLFGMGEEQWSPVDDEVKRCASTWDGFSCWDSAHPGTSAGTLGYHLGHRIISWDFSCQSPDINWDSGTSPGTLDHQLGLWPSWDINWDSGTRSHQLGLCPSRDIGPTIVSGLHGTSDHHTLVSFR